MSSNKVFDAISHPLRIEILRKLFQKPLGFADLKRSLKIKSSGLLDFHLKKMSSVVTTDKDGLYTLNDNGYAAIQAIGIISRHGWQRRSFFINIIVYIMMNLYFIIILPALYGGANELYWILALAVFGGTSLWVMFYSYWSLVKRRVQIRKKLNSE